MRTQILGLLAIAAGTTAFAQGFNIDVGANTIPFEPPGATYGAGAAQPGVWNNVTGAVAGTFPLLDLAGAASAVSITRTGSGYNFTFDNAGTFGDDQRLLDDSSDPSPSATWTINGLAPGNYRLYTYAWAPDSPGFFSLVDVPGSTDPSQTVGGGWTGSHAQGVTYALHHITIGAGGSIGMNISVSMSFATLNGFQIVQDSTGPGSAYCEPGAAGVMACPCGNNPVAGSGQGCTNSLGAGATISGAGTASVAASTVVISAAGIGSSGAACSGSVTALTCILLQGNANAAGGIAFNDGVRCFSGALKRLETSTSAGGMFTSTVNIPATSAALGDTIGATTFDRYYGVWHRDPCGTWACASPLNSNVSSSYSILWTP